MSRQTVFRILLAVVGVMVLAAAGLAVFQAGTAYGLAQSGQLAETGFRFGRDMMPGMGMAMGHRGLGFFGPGFGLFGLLGLIVKVVIALVVLRVIFGFFFHRGPWGWGRGFGPSGPGGPEAWEQHRRQKFEEWHKQAHEQSAAAPSTPSAAE